MEHPENDIGGEVKDVVLAPVGLTETALNNVDDLTSGTISEVIGKIDGLTTQLATGDVHRIRLETKLDELLTMVAKFPATSIEEIEKVAGELESESEDVVDDIAPVPLPEKRKSGRTLMRGRKG